MVLSGEGGTMMLLAEGRRRRTILIFRVWKLLRRRHQERTTLGKAQGESAVGKKPVSGFEGGWRPGRETGLLQDGQIELRQGAPALKLSKRKIISSSNPSLLLLLVVFRLLLLLLRLLLREGRTTMGSFVVYLTGRSESQSLTLVL